MSSLPKAEDGYFNVASRARSTGLENSVKVKGACTGSTHIETPASYEGQTSSYVARPRGCRNRDGKGQTYNLLSLASHFSEAVHNIPSNPVEDIKNPSALSFIMAMLVRTSRVNSDEY